jgi:bifunctional oligoribonuclease and PAP phosphatase NrnA
VPCILRFLPGLDLLTDPADFPAEPDVMITFDAAGSDRLGSLAANAGKARELIVVDHHASNTRFGTTHLVDPGAAATAAVVEHLIELLGVPLTHDIALDLYVGLVTDTGSFKYRSTTPEVHALAQRLLATGVRPEQVAREVWDRAPFGYLPVLAAALGRARLEPDVANGLGMVWTTVTRADRAAHDLPYDLLEGVIDVVRRTDEAEVAVVFKEDDEGAWQVSTRSKGRIDVGMACVALGGGGHPTAAGFTLHGEVESAVARLRGLLTEIEDAAHS